MALSHGTASSPDVPEVPLVLGGDVVASFSTLLAPSVLVVPLLVAVQLPPETVKSPSHIS